MPDKHRFPGAEGSGSGFAGPPKRALWDWGSGAVIPAEFFGLTNCVFSTSSVPQLPLLVQLLEL